MSTRNYCRTALCTVLLIAGIAGAHPPDDNKLPRALYVAKAKRDFFEQILQKADFPTNTVAQLQKAAKSSPRSDVRWSALYLLADRIGQDGVPAFKEALGDSDCYTRKTAALLLGAFADKSGIPVLRRDVATLTPRNGQPDPNMALLHGDELDRARSRRCSRLYEAIQAAEALSELGDAGGLELATYIALQGEYLLHRHHAVSTLATLIARSASDESVLARQTIDPTAVLIALAESETDPSVLGVVKGHAARLPREISRKIYTKLAASPHLSEKDRTMVQGYLKMFERQAKRQRQAGQKQE